MTVFISTEEGELLNLDHIQLISPTKVNGAGEQTLEARTSSASHAYRLFKGTPGEVEEFHERLKDLIRKSGGAVIDALRTAEKISNAKLDEQERTAPQVRRFDDGFFKDGEL